MGYDLGRAALACLAVVAIVVASSLFPAAGLGTFPGGAGSSVATGPGDGPGGSAGPGPVEGPATGDGPDSGTVTPADTTRNDTTDRRTTTTPGEKQTDPGRTTAETPTRTETATETETPAEPISDDGGDDDSGLLGAILFGLFGIPLLAALALTLGYVGGVVRPRRSGAGHLLVSIGGREIAIGRALQGLSASTMGLVLGLSSASSTLFSALGTAATGLVGGLAAAGAGGGSVLVAIPRGLATASAAAARGVGGALLAVPAGLGSLLSGASFGTGWGGQTPGRDARSADDTTPASPTADPEPESLPDTVEGVWAAFVEEIPVRNADARTPGEFARIAVERGLPADPVRRLTRTFQEVRYGKRPADGRFQRAREAFERIRRHREEGDG